MKYNKDFWKAKPTFTLGSKKMQFKPMFSIPNPKDNRRPLPRSPNKNLTFQQAQKQFFINPFGDWDKDNRINMFDCRPFNPNLHKVPEEHADKPVFSLTGGKTTFRDIFREAEEKVISVSGKEHIPVGTHLFKDEQHERDLSDKLAKALLKRMEKVNIETSPFKDLVGTYTIDVPIGTEEIRFILDTIAEYLHWSNPGIHFAFDMDNPKMVTTVEHRVTEAILNEVSYKTYKKPFVKLEKEEKDYVKNVAQQMAFEGKPSGKKKKLSKYLQSAPSYIQDLLSLLPPTEPFKVYITDYPVDMLCKSTSQGWESGSCERLTYTHSHCMGAFSDIEHGNALAFLYKKDKVIGRDKPSGRVMLRWGLDRDGNIDVGLEASVYGFKGGEVEDDILFAIQEQILRPKGFMRGYIEAPYVHHGFSDYPFKMEDSSGLDVKPHYHPYKRRVRKTPQQFKEDLFIRYKGEDAQFPEPYVRTLIREPQFTKSMLERKELSRYPDIVRRFASPTEPLEHRTRVAKLRPLPKDVMRGFITDEQDVRESFFERGDIPEDFLEEELQRALETGDTRVISKIIKRGKKPSVPLIKKLLTLNSPDILSSLVYREINEDIGLKQTITKPVIDNIMDYAEDKTIATLITIGAPVTNKVLSSLRELNREAKKHLAINSRVLPDSVLDTLFRYPPDGDFVGYLLNDIPKLKEKYQKVIAYFDVEEFNTILAGSTKYHSVASILSESRDDNVLATLARNENVPKKRPIWVSIIRNPNVLASTVKYIAGKTKTPDVILAITDYLKNKDMRDSTYTQVLYALTANEQLGPNTEAEVIAFAVEIGDTKALDNLIKNPAISSELKDAIRETIGVF